MQNPIVKTAISKNYHMLSGLIYNKRNSIEGLNLNDIDTKIKIYEDRVKEWFLEIADRLKRDNEAGFVILSIAVSYIEGNQQFREGKGSNGRSQEFFIRGMRRIFNKINVPERILKDYYKQIRCGLFHDGITKENVIISGEFQDPLRHINGIIRINPHKFLDKVKEDFRNYIIELENNKTLLDNFEKRFNLEKNKNLNGEIE